MYYILYDLKTLKVVHKDTKPLKPQNMNFYGIVEYEGEIPKNDWLTVDNVREKIETWKEKIQVEKLDENEQPLFNEQGELIVEEIEVKKSKTHFVCDLVAHFYPKIELTEEQKALQKQAKYESLVEKYIREKYSLSNEIAILRQASVKVEEFNEYNNYAEACKERAKNEVYGGN